MKNKIEYIATLLEKCSKHKFEQYVISRLWHMLDDDRIKIVTQQCIYIDKEKGERALADIYLPQVNIVIEVDEVHHLKKKEEDALREQGIIDSIGAEIHRINCTAKTDEDINAQLYKVVDIIKIKVSEKEKLNLFLPWDLEMEQTADYHKRKEYLSVIEGDYVKNTTEAFKIFDINFQQRSMAKIPGFNNLSVWCPYEDGPEWKNSLSNYGTILLEEYKGDKEGKCSKEPNGALEKRIVFLKGKNILGQPAARFIGIFKFDKMDNKSAVWRRFSYFCDMRNLFLYDNY